MSELKPRIKITLRSLVVCKRETMMVSLPLPPATVRRGNSTAPALTGQPSRSHGHRNRSAHHETKAQERAEAKQEGAVQASKKDVYPELRVTRLNMVSETCK